MKLIQTYFLGFSSAILLCVILAYILKSKRPVVSGLSIKCEYYLEVSEDSIVSLGVISSNNLVLLL
jgi:hypothetical protein